jgi:threonine/homoserine/homoserine lactone efflux protein
MLAQLVAFLGVSAVVICVPGPDTALTVRNALAGGRRCGVATAAGVAVGQAVWTLATSVGIAELIQASEPAFLVMKAVGAAYLVALGLQSLWAAVGIRSPGAAVGIRSPGTAAGIRSPGTAAGIRSLWTAVGIRFPGRLRSPTGGPGSGESGCRAPGARGPGADGWGSSVPGTRRAVGPGPGPGGSRAPAAAGGPGPGARGRMGPGRALRQGLVSNLANPKMAAFFLSLLPQFASPEQGAGGVVGLGLVFCVMTFGWLGLYSVVVDRARAVLGRPWVRRTLDGVSGVVLVGFGTRLALQQR